MAEKSSLIPDIDYYINDDGMLVFTKKYLLERGHCCQSGCTHCPYAYTQKIDPNVPAEFYSNWSDETNETKDFEDEEE